MKSLLLIAMLIVGLNCWPVDKDIDNYIDNEDISDKFGRSAEDSSFSEKSIEKSSEESSEISSEKSSELIKVPNYGPKDIGGGKQQLNLQRGGCLNDTGTPAHELMHAFGIIHEQSRPDRDDYVTIHKENIQPEQLHNFDMYSDNEVDNFGLRYGYDSVMHYPRNAFSVNGHNTIEPKLGYGRDLGQRRGPTTTDYEKINIIYGC